MRVGQTGSNQVQSTDAPPPKKTGKAAAAEKAEKARSGEHAARADAAASSGIEAGSAEISSKAKEFARAKNVAADAPEVREEKIAELRRRIDAGKYKVDSNAVADRMVDEHLHMSEMG